MNPFDADNAAEQARWFDSLTFGQRTALAEAQEILDQTDAGERIPNHPDLDGCVSLIPLGPALRVAAEIANWPGLDPSDQISTAALDLAAAIPAHDVNALLNICDRLDVYADCIGLHGMSPDDPDLDAALQRWRGELRQMVIHPAAANEERL